MNENEFVPVNTLHDFVFCKRFCYFKNVEHCSVSTPEIYEGKKLHDDKKQEKEYDISSDILGIRGQLDAVYYRENGWIVQEYKKGKSNGPSAWETDVIQVVAYAMLLEEFKKQKVSEARINYCDNAVTVKVPITETQKQKVINAVSACKELFKKSNRPDICINQRQCARCSLASICLPEEEREQEKQKNKNISRLFPKTDENISLHVITTGSVVSKTGNRLSVYDRTKTISLGLLKLRSLTIHGFSSISTQAIHALAYNNIPIHFVSSAGRAVSTSYPETISPTKRVRQFLCLTSDEGKLNLAKKVVYNKIKNQNALLSRNKIESGLHVFLDKIENSSYESLLGIEGVAAKEYFSHIPTLIEKEEYKPQGRTKRPPKDKFNAILSFLYTMLYNDVLGAVLNIGLDPSFGFYHKIHHGSLPLPLDIMEIFRVCVCDITAIGTVNKGWWNTDDFQVLTDYVWLSKQGKNKAIKFYNNRLEEKWKHSLFGYSLSYRRLIELEVKLFDKELDGKKDLFAKMFFR